MASALSPHSSQFSEKDVSGVETPVHLTLSPSTVALYEGFVRTRRRANGLR